VRDKLLVDFILELRLVYDIRMSIDLNLEIVVVRLKVQRVLKLYLLKLYLV
jgi:hypothetical protein